MIERSFAINPAIDRRGLAFKAIAGLIGGAIGWLPVELASSGHSLTEVQTTWTLISGFISMALMAGMIGGMIVAAEDQSFAITSAVQRRFIRGFFICAAIALPETYCSNQIFSAILRAGGWTVNQPGSEFFLVIARIVGWSLMGLMLGAGVGIASLSLQNILKGAAGGIGGGFVGGLLFDLIGALSQTGFLSRLIGFSVIGLAIGFFIGLVQELTKAAWLTVAAGRLKGRQYRLEGAAISIGRAEENPVGLFGDSAVQARHAVIEHRDANYVLRNVAVQAGTFVNGNRVETVALNDGDTIQIGGYELAFHTRVEPRREGVPTSAASSIARSSAAPIAAATDAPGLVRADGERLAIKIGAPTRIGRALDNEIVLNDASISRHHAVIETRNGAYVIRDLGSQNGTWLADQRVTEAPLTRRVTLRLGDVVLSFDG
ncbi:MAG TPA: FHA domain-containing protein [Candidatus Binataceae bacterium]|nr:FHA domain-containing protein [Candidatus Binataceae bacterium]